MLQRLKRSRQLNDRSSDDSLPSRSLLDVNLRYPVHYPFRSRRARSGLLPKERKKKNDACPLCPLYVYYDDSGRSVDVR